MNPSDNLSRKELRVAFVLTLIGIAALMSILFLTGCTIHVIYDPTTGKPVARSLSPWAPWFNNEATLANLTLTSETNKFRLGVKGVATSQTGDTNILNTITAGFNATAELAKKLPPP